MCGRYSLPDPEDIPIRFKGARFGYELKPRYNAAPSEDMPVVVSDGENHVELMRWGLVPFWAKDEKIDHNECCVKVCSKQGEKKVRRGQLVYIH